MTSTVKLLLAGDVMTGRGIDQTLPDPCPPVLYEPWIDDARGYVELAEQRSGPLPARRGLDYPFGDALAELARVGPAASIVNLETALTRSRDAEPGKQVLYRTSPENAACLRAAGLSACSLANNHVLDWGPAGLRDTIATLDRLGIAHAGAGADLDAASAPAVLPLAPDGRRLLLFAFAMPSSGTPARWAARPARPGVWFLPDGSASSLGEIAAALARWRQPGDLAIASVHWGQNWSFPVDAEEQRLARELLERLGFAVVHGHSSHHVRAIGVHAGRLALYGCGDLLDDYEGIGGYEEYRGDLGLLYFAELDAERGTLSALELVPTRMRRLRITRAGGEDAEWLRRTLDREGAPFGTSVSLGADGRLRLAWR